ncbi:MAG: hypothetical protein ABL949_14860 [Fimbriimonadaceae bacterium]
MTTNDHWRYFLALEQDVERTTRFVEPHVANYRTFSLEFVRLILSACSEVDVVAKVLCNEIDPSKKPQSITDYRKIILAKYPNFHQIIVSVPRFHLLFEPWKEWGRGENPGWWKDHQEVKHRRHEAFHKADLEHCIVSAGALFALTLYLCRIERISLERASFFEVEPPPHVGIVRKYPLPDDPL